jgi:proteasome-associated ATPase
MSPEPRRDLPDPRELHRLLSDDSVGMRQKCEYLRSAREVCGDNGASLDISLVRMIGTLRGKLLEAQVVQAQLEEVYGDLDAAFKRLTEPPLYPATFLERRTIGTVETALVHYNNQPRFVTLSDQFDGGPIETGEEVLLSGERNLLVGKLSDSPFDCGETVMFDRYTSDGRLVLSRRDEEVIAHAGAGLQNGGLEKGDMVRWNPSAWLAYEKVESSSGGHYFLEDPLTVTFDDIGGLDPQIEQLKNLVLLHLEHSDMTQRYGLVPDRAALLEGPPGTGKTMLVKALVTFLRSVSRTGRARFMDIKPGELGSMWYSRTEAKIRERFSVARAAAEADPDSPVVMFLDEIDSIASARGASAHRVDDRAVDALAVELDGLRSRGNILVLAATNRMDILDPALIRPGRFGDAPIKVGRPRRVAARAILSKYLRDDMPYRPGTGSNGANGDNGAAREEIIESTVSRLCSPNGDNDIATVTFRDASQRVVRLQDILSGALLAKIARSAARRACLRHIESGSQGIGFDDVLDAVGDEIETASRVLTPANCSRHLDDLPQDVDVVRVVPVERKPKNVHRFAHVA